MIKYEFDKTIKLPVLQLFDGGSQSDPLIMKVCGASLPSPSTVVSSGSKMLVRMSSDGSVNSRGFNASYITGRL